MTSTAAEKTVHTFRSLFSRYGIPDQIVTTSPQFIAEEFKQFCIGNGIKCTLIAPYHPSSNGEAEKFVQTFKTVIRKAKGALKKTAVSFCCATAVLPLPLLGKLLLKSCLAETSRPHWTSCIYVQELAYLLKERNQ